MRHPKTLAAFTQDQYVQAKRLLATRVAYMMGRKLEEDDWAYVYCTAKNIPRVGWSNLNIDIIHDGLGVEHKMLKKSNKPLRDLCGSSLMHPAATRSIRIPTSDDPNQVMIDVLTQYGELIEQRYEQVRQNSSTNVADLRTGWLLWQDSLKEFLYFEEEMLPPDPNEYFAEWRESGGGNRKASTNIWVYEKETGRKRYSITTEAGAKIQPYFDVPPPSDPNLYFFRVQGEEIESGLTRIWITDATARELRRVVGQLTIENVSDVIIKVAQETSNTMVEQSGFYEIAVPVEITSVAYQHLVTIFPGVSDEHMMQLLIQYLMESQM